MAFVMEPELTKTARSVHLSQAFVSSASQPEDPFVAAISISDNVAPQMCTCVREPRQYCNAQSSLQSPILPLHSETAWLHLSPLVSDLS